jgi:hypothetical protein
VEQWPVAVVREGLVAIDLVLSLFAFEGFDRRRAGRARVMTCRCTVFRVGGELIQQQGEGGGVNQTGYRGRALDSSYW